MYSRILNRLLCSCHMMPRGLCPYRQPTPQPTPPKESVESPVAYSIRIGPDGSIQYIDGDTRD